MGRVCEIAASGGLAFGVDRGGGVLLGECRAPTLMYATSRVIWRRSGCCVGRRAGCQARSGVTPVGVRHSPHGIWSGPSSSFQRGTTGRSCEGGIRGRVVLPSCRVGGRGFPRPVMVRRCSSLSTSFVLAALRALHVDSACVPGAEGLDRGNRVFAVLAPARWVVGGVVADQREGDAGGAVRECASDDSARLAA
jgi:hypothetical protein